MSELLLGIGIDLTTKAGVYWFDCLYMFLAVTIIWVICLFQGNHSMMDGFYGWGYASATWIPFWFARDTANVSIYACLLLLMATLHGARLGYYLSKRWYGYRKAGLGGDKRYLEFVTQLSPGYWWKSFFVVMQPQTIVIMLIGLPAYYGVMSMEPGTPLNFLAIVGMIVFGIGLYYEWLADGQLEAFKQNPRNKKGQYQIYGVWRVSRFPHYFGNTCVWWGIYLVAVAGNPDLWWTIAGPLFNLIMLTKILGMGFQDRNVVGKRDEYVKIKGQRGFFPKFGLEPPEES